MQPSDDYQYNFSKSNVHVYDIDNRLRKAVTIHKILKDFSGERLPDLEILSVGASTGVIEHYLSGSCKSVTGIDIDDEAIAFAQKRFSKDNVSFQVMDALQSSFPDRSFDIILCNHIYEHVPDPERLLSEIGRMLRPGGFCYFTAGNRLALMEPHYNLPFLSVLPRSFAHIYMRLAGKGDFYYEKHLTYWQINKLVGNFELIDYTKRIIEAPDDFAANYMIKPNSVKQYAAKFISTYLYWLCPTYIWILAKK